MKVIKGLCCMLMIFLCSACSYTRDETPGSLESVAYQDALQMIEDWKTFNLLLTADYCQHCQVLKEMLEEYLPTHHVDILEAQLMVDGKYLKMDEIKKDFPEFEGTPDLYVIENGKIKAHQAGSMTANEFDEFVRDHKLDEQE